MIPSCCCYAASTISKKPGVVEQGPAMFCFYSLDVLQQLDRIGTAPSRRCQMNMDCVVELYDIFPFCFASCQFPHTLLGLDAELQLDRMKQKFGRRVFIQESDQPSKSIPFQVSRKQPQNCQDILAYLRV